MLHALAFLLIALLTGISASPDVITYAPPMEVLAPGREAMTAFRLDEATAYFEDLADEEAYRLFARYHLSTIAYWKAICWETEVQNERFFGAAERLIREAKLAPASPWREYFLAEGYFQRAVIQANRGKYLKAAWDARRAYAHYRYTVEMWPDFADAYKGLGLLHVVVGSVPRTYRWILSFLGYGGSVQEGLEELERAARESFLGRREAHVYIALVDIVLNEAPERGAERMQQIYEAQPWSPLAAYLYAFTLLQNRRAREAETLLRQVYLKLQEPGYTYVPFVAYYLGEALYRQNRFAEAAGYFREFLEAFEGTSLVAVAHLKLGLSLEMMGNEAAAREHYRAVRAERDFDMDHWAYRLATRLLERPMSEVDRQMLMATNAYDGGAYAEAERLLKHLFEAPETSDERRTEAAYRLGRVYHALGRREEAEACYTYAVEHPVDLRAKWSPWAQFYLGELAEARGDVEAAREAYRKALRWKGPFDYEKALDQRARIALARLKVAS